ncbi:MAG TPA: SusC/RagA family TonB-linked outer membrane protein [Bacteroidales bacterium]|nr:SusC/RagA family TonB-linked outer membrane protein [Bacteroidales bacterium]
MRKLLLLIFVFCGFLLSASAQQRAISGTVTGLEDGQPVIGATVQIKGTTIGITTDINGKYSLVVPSEVTTLVFSYVGLKTQEVEISGQTEIDVVLESELLGLSEVVVTALGISREKKSLGYSVQQIGGEELNTARETNFVSSMSGKISGVAIKQPNTMGGSANIVIRGNASLLGNNQALFVVDGIPIDNSITNTELQKVGGGGFDYGNAAMDINPDDIESISVLKGAAASALYGSRAANGVVLVTTKRGERNRGLGVTLNSSVVVSKIDNATLPKYQKEYGGSYGAYYDDPSGYFLLSDIDGDGEDDLVVPFFDDASWGAKFDPNLMVVHWDALDPLAPNHGEKRPWVFPEHSIEALFKTGVKYTNNIAFDGGNDLGSFRLSYTNVDEKGLMANSSVKRNTLNLTGSYDLSSKLTIMANANYINLNAVGRYGTGYDADNPMQVFAQWFQTNVDVERLLNNYKSPVDGSHRSWNYEDLPSPDAPLRVWYANNPNWLRYECYNNDGRDRFFGYGKLSYNLYDWATIEGRIANDFYSEYQERRIAIGSASAANLPDYTKYLRTFNEFNADIMVRFNKELGDISINGLIGSSTRSNTIKSLLASTVGGLSIPNYFSLDNSIAPIFNEEAEILQKINSYYGSFSTGYKRFVFVDVTARYDISSTLPAENNSYFYPSISTSFILSELGGLKDLGFISFLKVRVNYAEVGADAPAYNTKPSYISGKPWGSLGLFSLQNNFYNTNIQPALYNPDLLPERTKSIEAGLEARFMNNRFGVDFSYYKNNTFDQIMPIEVSRGSGYKAMYINAGEIQNMGYELSLNAVPVQTRDFSWDIDFNWFKNKNEVVSLGDDIDNILIFQAWDVSVNATEGEPYGTIKGTNFVYLDWKKVVNEDGFYLKSAEDEVIGNINPDWNAGIKNTLRYKAFSISGLIDIQQGGDIFSVNTKHGLATGLYEETAGLNDKGNPKRDPVSEGGGYLFENTVHEDGTPNTTYQECNEWGTAFDYDASPTARYILDASYVKLRELALSYSIPQTLLSKTFIRNASLSIVGRNLWIIHKNTNHFDPEAALSAGNQQGIENGTYPTARTYGIDLKLAF